MPNGYKMATSYVTAKEAGTSVIEPNDVILSNYGYIKINEVEIAELKDIKIWFETETTKVSMIGMRQRGSVITDVQGRFSFTIYKIYSRFKEEVMKCYRQGKPFYFNLELTTKGRKRDSNGNETEESISIGLCWIDGNITISELDADAKFLNETYEGGFMIDSLNISPILDGEQWGYNG